jgi:hypothetical protein
MTLCGIPTPNALGKAFDLTARFRHSALWHKYAPRPFFLPVKSSDTSPSGDLTARMSSRFAFISRQPRHCRMGTFFGIGFLR